ncbi:MAG: hypothetical protein ACHQ1G_04305 [Planctomycetota bacterium]
MRRLLPLLAALSSLAAAEWTPPPTLDDLLGADCAVVGHFVEKGGAVRFMPATALWGDVRVVEELLKDKDFPVRIEENGGLTAWTWGSATGLASMSGFAPENGKQHAIWFFFQRSPRDLASQPVELTEGFASLRRARRVKPPALFGLLQRLDFDMRRDAMEDLVAGRDAEVLAELHRITLSRESLAGFTALDVLIETRLLDADRFWGVWTDHRSRETLLEILRERDPDRVTRELRKAIEGETRPADLAMLLYLSQEDVDTSIRYLDHPAEEVRDRALGNLYGSLWTLARTPGQGSRLDALAQRVLPLLRERRKVETSDRPTLHQMLEEKDGVPWVLRVPATVEPPAKYSEEAERDLVVSFLTSGQGGFATESAGREVAERFLADGFERLRKAAESQDFNTNGVYHGMGYVRHPSVFAHLVARAKAMSEGDDAFPAALRAIARQKQERSFDVLKEILEARFRSPGGFELCGMFDALALVRDERALDLLKGMRDVVTQGSALAYVRARAAHGDPWAIQELLTGLHEPSQSELLEYRGVDDVIGALLLVDTPEATEELKRSVRSGWLGRWESFDWPGPWNSMSMDMENCAGDSRRTTPIGEVARRDPRWLAELALEFMGSSSMSARVCGAYVFQGLTGRSFDFRPEAFAAERAAPLLLLKKWWAQHKTETREQWLLSHFRERGFPVTGLKDKNSLPVLVKALADPLTHDLAVERISVITGKYFTTPPLRFSERMYGQGGDDRDQRTTVRVTGWLEARKLLPAER